MEFAGMTDPDVTLTDYGLALLCAWFVWRMWRGPRFGPARFWLVLFFAAAGVAALLGGTVHGFFDLEGTTGHDVLWTATLIAIGVAALAAWGLGAIPLIGQDSTLEPIRWMHRSGEIETNSTSGQWNHAE